jgi:hypothetical protein
MRFTTVRLLRDDDWTYGNDTPVWQKPRRTVWFVYRRISGGTEYLQDKRGRLRTFRTYAGALRALRKLIGPKAWAKRVHRVAL